MKRGPSDDFWFHCYPAKWLTALAGMPPDLGYLYVMVCLRIYERRGPMPDDSKSLARRSGYRAPHVERLLDQLIEQGKLVRVEGGLMNPFAEQEITAGNERIARLRKVRSAAGKSRGQKPQQNQENDPANAQQKPTELELELELEKDSPEAKASGAAAPKVEVLDARTRLFREGLRLVITTTGRTEGQCRPMLGRWVKTANDDCVGLYRIIEDGVNARPADLVPWIEGALKKRYGGSGENNRRSGDELDLGFGGLAARLRSQRAASSGQG